MTIFALKEKLASLNSKLYVDSRTTVELAPGYRSAAIYLREPRKSGRKRASWNRVANGAQRILEAHERGSIDKYVTSTPADDIPEGDHFDRETGELLANGWRSIAMKLAKAEIAHPEKIQSVFGFSFSDYDHMTYDRKLKFFKENR